MAMERFIQRANIFSSLLANKGFVLTPVLINETTPILSDIDDNNNSMSTTAIFDQVPAMTSFDRWIEETYGNTPITSNVDENNNQTIVTQSENQK